MGGLVKDVNIVLVRWMEISLELRIFLYISVFLIGFLKVGFLRYRVLFFKVSCWIVLMIIVNEFFGDFF